jgi:hypothetical protein
MTRKWLITIAVLLMVLALPASAVAQQYLFSVDSESVDVLWNADGTSSLEYTWIFTDQPAAHPIDYVDVGMPTTGFDMSTVSADVNGTPVNVSQGDYQGSGSGFAVVLGSSTIQPGASGTVHVIVGRITGVLHPDTSDDTYASAVFSPTFFDSQYVVGSTNLTVTFHLPPGVQPNEPRYHMPENWPGSSEPQTGLDKEGRITYTWSDPSATATTEYKFGASFPKSYVPADAIVTAPAFDLGGLVSSIMGTLNCVPVAICGIFAFMFVFMPILGVIQGQRRKLQYLPPRVSIEGHGIKRGLTAVEAAILLEQPLDKVLTMVLFGVVKKGAAKVLSRDPLKVDVTDPLPDGVRDYEKDFLKAIALTDAPKRQKGLEDMMIALVKSVSEKMKGFSRKETQDYYKKIMEQAWAQVEAAQTPEVKGQKIDENLEWTMLDRDYDDRSRRVFTGPIFVPMWWGNYDPGWHSASTGGGGLAAPAAPAPRGSSALPGSAMAASVVGGVQSFSSKVVGNLNAFTGRVTNVTNPPPAPSRSGWSGGGGGGGGCACACACAGCACACAGGGR